MPIPTRHGTKHTRAQKYMSTTPRDSATQHYKAQIRTNPARHNFSSAIFPCPLDPARSSPSGYKVDRDRCSCKCGSPCRLSAIKRLHRSAPKSLIWLPSPLTKFFATPNRGVSYTFKSANSGKGQSRARLHTYTTS